MSHVTYKELTLIYGPKLAQALLRVLEGYASTDDKVIPFDYEERVRCAFEAMREERIAA